MIESMGQGRARVCLMLCTAMLLATSALAQTTTDAGKAYLGGLVGVQSVQNVGALAGLELGYHVSDRLDVSGEFTWLQDTVTRRRLDTAKTIAAFLQQSQGSVATSELDAPAVFGGGGIRWFATGERSLRPYVIAEIGVARVTSRPTFTLNGNDVTTLLPQYGITLGSDLTGSTSKPAFTGGFGVRTSRGVWRINADLRVTSIRTDGQASNVLRVNLGVGRYF